MKPLRTVSSPPSTRDRADHWSTEAAVRYPNEASDRALNRNAGQRSSLPYEEPSCRNTNPALFDAIDPLRHARARAICATCPFVQPCLRLALAIAAERGPRSRERGPDGTWAGLLWRDGRVVDPKRAETWRHTQHRRSA